MTQLEIFTLSYFLLFIIFFFCVLMFKTFYYKNLFVFFLNTSQTLSYREKLQYYKKQLIKYEISKRKYYYICLLSHYCFSIFYIGFFCGCLFYLHDFIKNQNIPNVEILFTFILGLELIFSILSLL